MKARALTVFLGLALLGSGCGRHPVPRGPVAFPAEDDYERPSVVGLDAGEAATLSAAWDEIGVGDTEAAVKRLTAALSRRSDAAPLRAALGYAHLRARRLHPAEAEFARVLAADPNNRSALVGAATTARRLGEVEEALALYRRAREGVDNPALDQRIQELSSLRADALVTEARRLRSEGRLEDAVTAYRKALQAAPTLGGLRPEWADALVELGRFGEALALLDASEPGDRVARLHLARLLAEDGDITRAIAVLEALAEKVPEDAGVAERLEELRRARLSAEVPAEVRAIAEAPLTTRADLAALLVTRVPSLREAEAGSPPVVTDIEGLWARDYVVRALALDLMETYPNHTFQPGATVRRGDLAQALGRTLARAGRDPGAAPPMKDVTPNNRLYPEIVRTVAAGLLSPNAEGAFEPWRPVTGAEATQAVERLSEIIERP